MGGGGGGGGGQRVCWPPLKLLGGGGWPPWPPLASPLPTPMGYLVGVVKQHLNGDKATVSNLATISVRTCMMSFQTLLAW